MAARRSILLGPDARRFALGIVLIIVILFGQQIYGWATSGGRLDASLRNASGPKNIIVVLGFTPERFHNERISSYGVFAGRDGALHHIRLRMVDPVNLASLASIPWVARIEPLK